MGKWRVAQSYKRAKPTKQPYETVLIVCEGSKTEPNYLNRFRARFGLASVDVENPGGTDPMTVAKYALERLIDDKQLTRAYCVFDRDSHANFAKAIQLITNSKEGKEGRLIAITSQPCFEIWVSLHFTYCDRPFAKAGKKSICDKVVEAVEKHLPSYTKGLQTIFDALADKLPDAIKHARRLAAHNGKTNSTNPSTGMHILMDYLQNLKKQRP
jgi:hypothetical protein